MRILHTIAHYPPAHGGGATEVVRQVSERLARRGHTVTVATSFSPCRQAEALNGVAVRQFRIDGVLQQSVLGIRGEAAAFRRFLCGSDFDVVMNYAAQTWHTDLTCRCLPDLQARAVLAACGYSGLVGWRRPLYWRYFRRLPRFLRQYDAVVYHDAGYRDALFGQRHRIDHGRVIPNGTDICDLVAPSVNFRTLYNVKTPYLLLTVGDHYHNKGHARLYDTFRQLARPDVTLVVIGRDLARWPRSCQPACCREAARSAGRILLVDGAPRAHVAAAYAAADLFLSGSYIEAFPLVILESMASGVPFVGFPAGNMERLPGGRMVRTTREMTQSINQLLDNPDERRELGATGRAEQRLRYDWERITDQYEQLYRDLLSKPARTRR